MRLANEGLHEDLFRLLLSFDAVVRLINRSIGRRLLGRSGPSELQQALQREQLSQSFYG